jgi:hypothetical protein
MWESLRQRYNPLPFSFALGIFNKIQWRWWPIGPRQGDLIFLVIVIATAFYIKKRAFPKQREDPFFCASWA